MKPLRLLAVALLAPAAINPWQAVAATSRSTKYDGTTSAYYRYDAKPTRASRPPRP